MKRFIFTIAVIGAVAMTTPTTLSPEMLAKLKAAKQDPTGQIWTEKVTVRVWAKGKDGTEQFLDPVKDVEANRIVPKITKDKPAEDKVRFRLHSRFLAHLGKGSEITDKDGKVYIVSEVKPTTGYMIAYANEQKKP